MAADADDSSTSEPKSYTARASLEISRRSALINFGAFATTTTAASWFLFPTPALAVEDNNKVPISASWNAVDGLNSNDSNFVAFDSSAYQAMMNDPARTPFF